jgi:predicted RNA-binding protein associated with RNAse of E/G family
MVALAPVVEIKRRLAGGEQRFSCRRLAGDGRHAVVLWVAPAPMSVHGVVLPAGTISFGHFWIDRPYNVYHWLDRAGQTLGYYFNVCDQTRLSDGVIEWRDLVLDVLVLPGAPPRLLDEDELAQVGPLDAAAAAHVAAGRAALLGDTRAITGEIEAASRALFPLVSPDAA